MLTLLLGCHASLVIDKTDTGEPVVLENQPMESLPGLPDSPDPPDTGGDDNGEALFDDTRIHQIQIDLSRDASIALRRAPDTYVEADIDIDGKDIAKVGVHIKGSSSLRTLEQKAAFKVDFNRFVADQDYEGIPKLTLNNMVNDDTQLHEAMAWKFYKLVELPWNRVSYAWLQVSVDGVKEDFGLYIVLETWGGDWLERNFGVREGNLYEGGYPYYPDSWAHADYNAMEARNFEQEYGEDIQNADIIEASTVLGGRADDWATAASQYINIDEYARYHAAEVWVGHWDGYVFATNNFRTWVDASGKVKVLPSGVDWTFQDWASWNNPNSSLGDKCWMDESCRSALATQADFICDAVENGNLEEEFDRLQALIEPMIEADPRAEYNKNQIPRQQDTMRRWLGDRCSYVRGLFQAQ